MKLDNFHNLSEVDVRLLLAHLAIWLISSYECAVSVMYFLKKYFYSVQTFCMREILEVILFISFKLVAHKCVTKPGSHASFVI